MLREAWSQTVYQFLNAVSLAFEFLSYQTLSYIENVLNSNTVTARGSIKQGRGEELEL